MTCIFILFFYLVGNANILSLSEGDTVYINYSIAYFGEYGGAEEGIIIFKNAGVLKARYVSYNSNDYKLSFNLNDQGIIRFFTVMKNDYQIIMNDWALDTSQIYFINNLIDDLKTHIPENGVSNASEFYFLQIGCTNYVIIDRIGSWDKYKDIHKCFNLEVVKPKRMYLLGIKLRSKELKYILKNKTVLSLIYK